jgi:hypothetical protein
MLAGESILARMQTRHRGRSTNPLLAAESQRHRVGLCWKVPPLTSHRLRLCLLLSLTLGTFVPGEARGRGGTNMHEFASSRPATPSYEPTLPSKYFGGCGRGRYRDLPTRKCRGPADFGN